ncbi:hypothetical protein L3Q82_013006, partial [Scortum barcoo]
MDYRVLAVFIYFAPAPTAKKKYTLITSALNWLNAQAYCREYYTDLAMIDNDDENADFLSVKGIYTVWIGLYRIPWTWSDNSKASFTNWMSGRPDNFNLVQHCVAHKEGHLWDDENCNDKYPFLCNEGFGLTSCTHLTLRQYRYVNLPMTWADARQYCREKHADLATFESMDDINRLQPSNTYTLPAWIGLNDDPRSWKGAMTNDENSWRWSTTAPTPTNKKKYTLITNALNWTDAQAYCREYYTDLAMIENDDENADFLSVKGTVPLWIGLYRIPWTWSDNSKASFTNWMSGRPDNLDGVQHCVAHKEGHLWDDENCNDKHPFFCNE